MMKTIKRIAFDLILFAAVFMAPWWLTAVVGLLFVILFKNYWEVIIAAIFMDAIYYIPSNKIWGNFGIFTLSFLLIVIIAEKVKKQVRI